MATNGAKRAKKARLFGNLNYDQRHRFLSIWNEYAAESPGLCNHMISRVMSKSAGVPFPIQMWRPIKRRLLQQYRSNPTHPALAPFQDQLARISNVDLARRIRTIPNAHKPLHLMLRDVTSKKEKAEIRKAIKKQYQNERKRSERGVLPAECYTPEWTSSAIDVLLHVWLKHANNNTTSMKCDEEGLTLCAKEIQNGLRAINQVFLDNTNTSNSLALDKLCTTCSRSNSNDEEVLEIENKMANLMMVETSSTTTDNEGFAKSSEAGAITTLNSEVMSEDPKDPTIADIRNKMAALFLDATINHSVNNNNNNNNRYTVSGFQQQQQLKIRRRQYLSDAQMSMLSQICKSFQQ